jgi:hypothetical protein
MGSAGHMQPNTASAYPMHMPAAALPRVYSLPRGEGLLVASVESHSSLDKTFLSSGSEQVVLSGARQSNGSVTVRETTDDASPFYYENKCRIAAFESRHD